MPLYQTIHTKRIYKPATADDGTRVLVDGIWPRGMKKEDARIDRWMKEIAPSKELRKWFGHDPEKWQQFKHQYKQELEKKQKHCKELLSLGGPITLLFSAREETYNHAVVLKEYLQSIKQLT